MLKMRDMLVVGLMGILGACSLARGQVIRLKGEVTVAPHEEVRLGTMATISGADARTLETLSNTVILEGSETTRTVKAESVLLALMSQHGPGTMGSSLQIAGAASCVVAVKEKEAAAKVSKVVKPEAPVAAISGGTAVITAVAMPKTDAPVKEATAGEPLAKVLVSRLQNDLKLPADDVRVTIETISPLLDAPVAAGRKWLVRPLTRTLLGTVQFETQLVEGSRVVEKLNVTTRVLRRQMVVVSLIKLDRGDVVSVDAIQVEEAWLDRQLPTLFKTPKEVAGLESQRALDIGATLDQRDFKPAMMASRGDSVTVIFLSGPLKVQMRGRAMEEGKLHDQVEVRNEMTGEKYQAVLIGKRLAVVGGTLTADEEKKLQETR